MAQQEDTPQEAHLRDRLLARAEDIIYGGIALLLVVNALVLLVWTAGKLLQIPESGVQTVAIGVLDALLLVFIVVELLFAVRATLVKRELVAEPFLLVGIIASIKEILFLSLKAAELLDKGPEFARALAQIGVLGGLTLVLAAAVWILRRKEREPEE
jgi:uncharacterized membrane protein (DUF373 family)